MKKFIKNINSCRNNSMTYYTYILRCADGSLYTGITTDIQKRMAEHFGKTEKCAKYTRSHTAEKLESVWKSEGRSAASKLEYRIKQLTRKQKQKLIDENDMTALKEMIVDDYQRINFEI